jgi:hypothetical protein
MSPDAPRLGDNEGRSANLRISAPPLRVNHGRRGRRASWPWQAPDLTGTCIRGLPHCVRLPWRSTVPSLRLLSSSWSPSWRSASGGRRCRRTTGGCSAPWSARGWLPSRVAWSRSLRPRGRPTRDPLYPACARRLGRVGDCRRPPVRAASDRRRRDVVPHPGEGPEEEAELALGSGVIRRAERPV